MNLQESCELLFRIEQEIDVNAMSYEGAHLWPLVRQFLWVSNAQKGQTHFEKKNMRCVRGEDAVKQKPSLLDHLNHIVKKSEILPDIKRFWKIRRQELVFAGKTADICFLSQPIYYSERLDNQPYSRIIDPVYEALCSQYHCIKIEEAPRDQALPLRKYPCHFFNALPLKKDVNAKVDRTIKRNGALLKEISSLADIEKMELSASLSAGLRLAIKYRDTYSLIFKKIQPKFFFLASYYFPPFMGLNWAACINNIPTIDLQHGKQGKFQGMYSHWSAIPEEGYALLPTWFWTWGKPSTQNIMKWQSERKTHYCVVGGYPWLGRWNESEFSHSRLERLQASKIILVTTQAPVGGLDDFFPDMLVDAIQQSPEDWYWIIREHPNYKQGNAVLKDKLKHLDKKRYVMDVYNDVPLYTLLSRCNFHVTAFSSVCYEAEAFSVPTAIFSKIGREMYKQEIEKGYFIFCDTSQSLLHAISFFDTKENKEKYIEYGNSLVLSALEFVDKESRVGCQLRTEQNESRPR